MNHISIHCRNCKQSFWVKRTSEIPDNVEEMACNWCPCCEDHAQEYYREWYLYAAKSQCPTARAKQLRLEI